MKVTSFHVPVLEPLLEMAAFADLIRRQTGTRRDKLLTEFLINSEDFCGVDTIGEQVSQYLHVHCRSCTDTHAVLVPVLRRYRRACNEPLGIRVLYKSIEEKFSRAFHCRINLFQELFVSTIVVVVPEMFAQPRATCRPEAIRRSVNRSRCTPNIGIVMAYPATSTVHNFCCASTGFSKVHYKRDERFSTLGKICRLSRPVIHLGVDVDGVLAFPRWGHAFVPDTLQICRLAAGPRAADKQVSSELEIKCRKLWVIGLFRIADSLIGRKFRHSRRSEVQLNSTKQPLMLCNVIFA